MYPFTLLAFIEYLLCARIVLDAGDPNRKDKIFDFERSQFWEEARGRTNRDGKIQTYLTQPGEESRKVSQERYLNFQGKIKVSHGK